MVTNQSDKTTQQRDTLYIHNGLAEHFDYVILTAMMHASQRWAVNHWSLVLASKVRYIYEIYQRNQSYFSVHRMVKKKKKKNRTEKKDSLSNWLFETGSLPNHVGVHFSPSSGLFYNPDEYTQCLFSCSLFLIYTVKYTKMTHLFVLKSDLAYRLFV